MKIRKTRAERKLERQIRDSHALMSRYLKGDHTILAKDGEGAARFIRTNTDWGQKASMQVIRERCNTAIANGELTQYVDRGKEVFLQTTLARAKRAERESGRTHLTSMAVAR